MKKSIIFSLAGVILSVSAAGICFAGDVYFCPEDKSSYVFTDIYDPSSNCDIWNNDFWKKNNPNAYNECVQRKNRQKQMLSRGQCEKVLQKTFSYGGQNCTFKIIESRKSITETSCFAIGSNPMPLKDVQNEFKRRYGYK